MSAPEFSAHPVVLRRQAWLWAITLPTAAVMGWFLLPRGIRDLFTGAQIATLVLFVAVLIGGILTLASASVTAGPDGLRFRNGVRRHHLAWPEVASIRYGLHDAWAFVERADGDDMMLMGIMRTDGARAQRLADDLRAVHAKYRAGSGAS